MNVDLRHDRWFVAGAVVSILMGSIQLYRITVLRSATPEGRVAPRSAGTRFPLDIDRRLVHASAQTGVSRLDSVEVRGSAREQLRAEWQSASSATVAFLAAAESAGVHADHLRAHAAAGGTRWTLTAHPGNLPALPARPVSLLRDPFVGVATSASPSRAPARRVRESTQAKQSREDRERAEAVAAAEAQLLGQRRRDIVAGVRISATMNNGHDALALADVNEGGRRHSITLHEGDVVMNGRVAAIDDRAGTVSIDIGDKTPVLLGMSGAAP